MLYLLALLLPPLAIIFAGRPFVGLLSFFFWLPAIVISGGLGHPIFILLAWVLIYQQNAERLVRRGTGRRD